jgi:hypothetical protein
MKHSIILFYSVETDICTRISLALLHIILASQQMDIFYAFSREEEIESSNEALIAL